MARWTEEVAYREGSDVQFKINEENKQHDDQKQTEKVQEIQLTPPPQTPPQNNNTP